MSTNSWPEQDAIDAWWEKHRMELKKSATVYRIKLQERLASAERIIAEMKLRMCPSCGHNKDNGGEGCDGCPVHQHDEAKEGREEAP